MISLHDPLISIITILGFGLGAQWLAWHLRVPSILFLLVFGFVAGPVTGLVKPDALLGDLLIPIVSLSVAVILFEGGLTLKLSDLKTIGRPVRNLVLVGVPVTWALVTLAARFILEMEWTLALLLGAILVVTGPTVIVPILRHLRLTPGLGSVLKWEGMLNDPVGVILAVLVFDAILSGTLHTAPMAALLDFGRTMGFALLAGVISGYVMILLLARYWIPDYLQSIAVLVMAMMTYGIANNVQMESGLMAVTVMGIVLANQKKFSIKHIVEFKENLRVLLISVLFIVLGARLEWRHITSLDMRVLAFFVFTVLVVRPAAVLLSTWRSGLPLNQKLFLAWMAPRGIVAAATASIFALSLEAAGFKDAERILTITFAMIIASVLLYGLSSAAVAYLLRVASPNPQGLLIAGSSHWVQNIAAVMRDLPCKVLLVDTNEHNVRDARQRGLPAISGNILLESFVGKLDLSGIGRFIGMTSNDEVNSFAAQYFAKILGSDQVYQLPVEREGHEEDVRFEHLHGRPVFDNDLHYTRLRQYATDPACIQKIELNKAYNKKEWVSEYGEKAYPLFVMSKSGGVRIIDADRPYEFQKDEALIYVRQQQT